MYCFETKKPKSIIGKNKKEAAKERERESGRRRTENVGKRRFGRIGGLYHFTPSINSFKRPIL